MLHVIKSKDPKIPPRLQLDPSWRPSRDPKTGTLLAEGRLWDFTEKIAGSRREGKNRRDGATVSSRVLHLADTLGRKLFDEIAEPDTKGKVPSRLSQEEQESVRKSRKTRRGRGKLEGAAPRL